MSIRRVLGFRNPASLSGGGGGGSGVADSGQATLVNGTVIVSSSHAAAGAVIVIANGAPAGIPGELSVGAIVDGVSFEINSSTPLDTSTVNWVIA